MLVLALGAGWLWTPDKSRVELEATYARGPGDFTTLGGQRLHVRDSGPPAGKPQAPVLVLLHGFGASLHTWQPWAQALQDDFRVISLDQPGAGLSPPDIQADYTDARGVQLLLSLLDERGIARATLVGHSIGGRLAFRFAAAHPQRVDKLVLLAPDGFASPGFEYGRTPDVPAVAGLVRYSLPRALVRQGLKPAYGDPARLTEATVTRYHDLLLAPGARAALLQRLAQVLPTDPTATLQAVQAPTLLVWGERDQMIPVANARDFLRVMRNAQLVTVPGVGHLPQEEDPAAALPALRAFLLP